MFRCDNYSFHMYCIFVILQYCNGGDLADYLQGKRFFSLYVIIKLPIQVALSLLLYKVMIIKHVHYFVVNVNKHLKYILYYFQLKER